MTAISPARLVDVDDPRAAVLRRMRGDSTEVVVEGEQFVRRAVAAGHELELLVTTPGRRAAVGSLGAAARCWLEAEPELLAGVVGFTFHRGVLGVVKRPRGLALRGLAERERTPLARFTAVAAERVADPANLGAIVRNAAAFGADGCVCDEAGADPWSRKAIRASAGWVFSLPLVQSPDLRAAAADLRAGIPGLEVVAAVAQGEATPLSRFTWPAHVLLLLGNEGDGLSEAAVALAQHRVTIDMAAGIDSLNVAAASAVLLWARSHGREVADP